MKNTIDSLRQLRSLQEADQNQQQPQQNQQQGNDQNNQQQGNNQNQQQQGGGDIKSTLEGIGAEKIGQAIIDYLAKNAGGGNNG